VAKRVSDERLAEMIGELEVSNAEESGWHDLLLVALELRERREAERWVPVGEKMPDCMYVLMAGRSSSGTDWRDVGVYRGDGDFVDKYGSGSHPTHWRPLPAAPEVKP
jgi:hypothetical protein